VKKDLDKVTQLRQQEGLFGDFIQKLQLDQTSKVFIFGDLCGAFHSFMRDLMSLKSQAIISNQFVLKEGCYIVFNGNVTDRGPYILETVSVILKLLIQNPSSVFYIRGIEDKQGWAGKTFEHELNARFKASSVEKIPLIGLFTRFFETLPVSLFLTFEEKSTIRSIQLLPRRKDKAHVSSQKQDINKFLHDSELSLFNKDR
jgi:hypothetical protein